MVLRGHEPPAHGGAPGDGRRGPAPDRAPRRVAEPPRLPGRAGGDAHAGRAPPGRPGAGARPADAFAHPLARLRRARLHRPRHDRGNDVALPPVGGGSGPPARPGGGGRRGPAHHASARHGGAGGGGAPGADRRRGRQPHRGQRLAHPGGGLGPRFPFPVGRTAPPAGVGGGGGHRGRQPPRHLAPALDAPGRLPHPRHHGGELPPLRARGRGGRARRAGALLARPLGAALPLGPRARGHRAGALPARGKILEGGAALPGRRAGNAGAPLPPLRRAGGAHRPLSAARRAVGRVRLRGGGLPGAPGGSAHAGRRRAGRDDDHGGDGILHGNHGPSGEGDEEGDGPLPAFFPRGLDGL